MLHCTFSSATLQSTWLSPSSSIYGLHIICGLHTDDHRFGKKQLRKKAQILSPLAFEIQPHRAPGNLLLFSTGSFFPVDVWYWAHRPSLTKHRTSLAMPWGSARAPTVAAVEAAFLGHYPYIFLGRQFGGRKYCQFSGSGCLSQAHSECTTHCPRWLHRRKKIPFLNRIVKERGVRMLKL